MIVEEKDFWGYVFIVSLLILFIYEIPMLFKVATEYDYRKAYINICAIARRMGESQYIKKVLVIIFNIILYILVVFFFMYCFVYILQDHDQSNAIIRGLYALSILSVYFNWLGIGYASMRSIFGFKVAFTALLAMSLNLLGMLLWVSFLK